MSLPCYNHKIKILIIITEIKTLIALKRRARAKWHRIHAPQDKTALNRATNQLKAKIKAERDRSFHEYVSSLNRFDNSIWKPIKHRSKPIQQIPPIQDETPPTPQWARSDEVKSMVFAVHLAKVFTPINNDIDNDIEEQLSNIPINNSGN